MCHLVGIVPVGILVLQSGVVAKYLLRVTEAEEEPQPEALRTGEGNVSSVFSIL